MDLLVALTDLEPVVVRREDLEAENARLRLLLSQATELADSEMRRNARLNRMVENGRIAAEHSATRLASAEELNAKRD